MAPDLSHYIPTRIDGGGKFLFWDFDVAGIFILGAMTGIGCDYPILGLLLGLMLAFGYAKLKSGKHPGLAVHLLYWWTGFPVPTDLPASYLREFNG